jgi:hypothetical protein
MLPVWATDLSALRGAVVLDFRHAIQMDQRSALRAGEPSFASAVAGRRHDGHDFCAQAFRR